MAYEVKIIADSISPDRVRLTSVQATFPRFILAEVNTHRMLVKSSASSRAIPVKDRIAQLQEDPFVPEAFSKNQKGMQASEQLEGDDDRFARLDWLGARDAAIGWALALAARGVHKQHANRLLEPFAWHTALITGTEWANFFALRCNANAQPEFRKVAELMRDAMAASEPRAINYGEWHLPYLDPVEAFELEVLSNAEKAVKVSVGRCARTSYLTQEGKRDYAADLALYDRLASSGHMAPLEHPARPAHPILDRDLSRHPYNNENEAWFGCLRGWVSHRKTIPGEDVFRG